MMANGNRLISGDTHLEIDSSRWVHRVADEFQNRVPRLLRLPDGGDAWLVEGLPLREVPMDLYAGKGRDVWHPYGQAYDSTAGTGDAKQRLGEQDRDGVDAEVLFPGVSGPTLWRSVEDDDAYRAIVRGYNEFLATEYCAESPTRLIGVGVIPETGLTDATKELAYCKSVGLRAISLSKFPSGKNYPTAEDDSFWAAALDSGMAVTIHQELNRSGEAVGNLLQYQSSDVEAMRRIRGQVRFAEQVAKFGRTGGINAVQFALSGVFDRFPDLRIFFAETQIGWLPIFYEMADLRFDRHRGWAEDLLGWQPVKRLPSEYFREHCYWGFQQDRSGVLMRDVIGVDRLVWATDFPHQESEWPESSEVLARNFEGVPEADVTRMTCSNITDFLRL
jgi:uncharacterized protein